MANRNDIIERIKKLLALAEDELCKRLGRDYVIKSALRAEM